MTKVYPLAQIKYNSQKGISRYRSILVASGILIVKGKVLLIKRINSPDKGSWVLPSGHCEQNETPKQAAAREFYEETGLRVQAKQLVSVENYFYTISKTRTIIAEFIYEVVTINPDSLKVTLDDKHSEYCFVSVKKLTNFSSLVSPRVRAIKKIYHEKYDQIYK